MKGFTNTDGNMCYFTTALHCLLHTPVISNHLIKNPYTGPCSFTRLYSALVLTYWSDGGGSVLRPDPIHKVFQETFPRFKSREQHDVQETILCIIDILERSVPELKQWVYGLKRQETVWPGGSSVNTEAFSVHIVRSEGTCMGTMLMKSMDWNTLDAFEDTDGKIHGTATTRMLFEKVPPVFMVSFDTKSHVEIIHRINMDGIIYRLVACAIHIGNQDDGHYVACVHRDGEWFLINDERIEKCTLPEKSGYYFMVYING